jgi:hypothetical protein
MWVASGTERFWPGPAAADVDVEVEAVLDRLASGTT